MKSKKKMLLALGAMSVAAIGAGSVSTFAWYTASASAKIITKTDVDYSVLSTTTTVSLTSVQVRITIAKDDTFNGGKNVQLSYYDSSDVKVGGMANGVEVKDRNWSLDNGTEPIIGKYKATATFVGDRSAAQTEALKNMQYDVAVSAGGNVKILHETSSFDSMAKAGAVEGTSADLKITVRFTSAGAIEDCVVNRPYYRVETNNPLGMEAIAAPAKTYSASSAEYALNEEITYSGNVYKCVAAIGSSSGWETDKTSFVLLGTATPAWADPGVGDGYSVGDVVYVSTTYYRLNLAAGAKTNPSSDTTNWSVVKLHSEDKISVANDQDVSGTPRS